MGEFRITKYDPSLRDADGAYRRAEWTSVSDIGKQFGADVLSVSEYMEVEDAYVRVAKLIMEEAGVRAVRVVGLERGSSSVVMGLPDAGPVGECASALRDGCIVAGKRMEEAIRANLRELVWCKLLGTGGFFLHFGWDYYMFAGGNRVSAPSACPRQVFVEVFVSPYHDES